MSLAVLGCLRPTAQHFSDPINHVQLFYWLIQLSLMLRWFIRDGSSYHAIKSSLNWGEVLGASEKCVRKIEDAMRGYQ